MLAVVITMILLTIGSLERDEYVVLVLPFFFFAADSQSGEDAEHRFLLSV